MAWVYPIKDDPPLLEGTSCHNRMCSLTLRKKDHHFLRCNEGSKEECVSLLLERYRTMFHGTLINQEAFAFLLGHHQRGGELCLSNDGIRQDIFGEVCVLAAKLEYAALLDDVAHWIDIYGPTLQNVVQFELLLKENPRVALALYGNDNSILIEYTFDESNASVVPVWGVRCIESLKAEWKREKDVSNGVLTERFQLHTNLMSKLSTTTLLAMIGVTNKPSNVDGFVQWSL